MRKYSKPEQMKGKNNTEKAEEKKEWKEREPKMRSGSQSNVK